MCLNCLGGDEELWGYLSVGGAGGSQITHAAFADGQRMRAGDLRLESASAGGREFRGGLCGKRQAARRRIAPQCPSQT